MGQGGYAAEDSPDVPTRGYFDGCFDIMHSGHYNAIRQAKCISDTLVVGIHSDEEIEANKALPVMRQVERYALLEHIKWIDEILHDVPYSPEIATLDRAKADFCVHGDDMPLNSEGVSAYDEVKRLGRLRIVRRTEGVSTTDMIGRLLTLSKQHHDAPRASSPTTGIRLGAEAAVQQILASPRSSPRGKLPTGFMQGSLDAAAQPAGEVVEGLITKYKMTPEDAALLRNSVTLTAGATTRPALTPGSPTNADLRAKAPVQLLASTRRLVEFASSKQPTAADRVVYVSGSFDMFHVGHAQFLKEARALGTFLLVGIHEDLTVRQTKGPSFPVMNLNERVLNVCACKWVDEVIIGAPKAVSDDIMKTWAIHIVARGTGHKRNPNIVDRDWFTVAKAQNVFKEVPSKWPELCHNTIVERIMASRQSYLKRNTDRAKREDAYYDQKSANDPKEHSSLRSAA